MSIPYNKILVRASRSKEEMFSGVIKLRSGLYVSTNFVENTNKEKTLKKELTSLMTKRKLAVRSQQIKHLDKEIEKIQEYIFNYEAGEPIIIERHTCTEGVVTKICNELIFEIGNPDSVEYDVDMELQVNDTVIFSYLSQINKFDRNEYIEDENYFYFFLNYDEIFVAKRNEDIICINGWNLIEPKEKIIKTSLEIGEAQINKSENWGVVRHKAPAIRAYKNLNDSLDNHDIENMGNDDIEVGDEVYFGESFAIPLQYPLYKTLDKDYYRIQRKNILLKKTTL